MSQPQSSEMLRKDSATSNDERQILQDAAAKAQFTPSSKVCLLFFFLLQRALWQKVIFPTSAFFLIPCVHFPIFLSPQHTPSHVNSHSLDVELWVSILGVPLYELFASDVSCLIFYPSALPISHIFEPTTPALLHRFTLYHNFNLRSTCLFLRWHPASSCTTSKSSTSYPTLSYLVPYYPYLFRSSQALFLFLLYLFNLIQSPSYFSYHVPSSLWLHTNSTPSTVQHCLEPLRFRVHPWQGILGCQRQGEGQLQLFFQHPLHPCQGQRHEAP